MYTVQAEQVRRQVRHALDEDIGQSANDEHRERDHGSGRTRAGAESATTGCAAGRIARLVRWRVDFEGSVSGHVFVTSRFDG